MTGDERHDAMEDEALARALGAPGSPAELAGEDAYRAMFRAVAAEAPRARLAVVRRVGTGSALAVALAVAGAGAAAAYTTHLPDPVQRVVHSALGPIGVPDAPPRPDVDPVAHRRAPTPLRPEASPAAPPAAVPTASATSTPPSPSATPTVRTPSPGPSRSATPTPSAAAPPPEPMSQAPSSAATSPSTTPPAQPRPKPAAVSIAAADASHRVSPGAAVSFSGRVTTADGTAVPDRQVVLQQRGPDGWQRVVVARTGADGAVAVASGAVQRTTSYRLRVGTVHSASWRIVLQPSLTVSAETVGRAASVTVSAAGGQTGDRVLLLTRRRGRLVQEARGTLDPQGRARFELTAPKRARAYVVRLPATPAHAAARAAVTVAAAGPDAG
ncbi:hypothetical protein [Nocardioides sp. URHA0020]|uniref:hypothetical protein n=1 Tax=Nocardioides sp. URHA0020 TaxID=1380392 RepID=UPI00049106EE|nr:hypothetical protein [Nocardioides sp. URHA0020]